MNQDFQSKAACVQRAPVAEEGTKLEERKSHPPLSWVRKKDLVLPVRVTVRLLSARLCGKPVLARFLPAGTWTLLQLSFFTEVTGA